MLAVSPALKNMAENAVLEEGLAPLPRDHHELTGGLLGGKAKLWGRQGRPANMDGPAPPVEDVSGGTRICRAVMRNAMALRRLPNNLEGDKTIRKDFEGFFNLLRAPISPLVEYAVVQDPRIRSISGFVQQRMMAAERRIERAWAEQLLRERRLTMSSLRQFWYYSNYQALCDTEIGLMHRGEPGLSLTCTRDRIALVGGGALPISAMMLHDVTGIPITVIDYNPKSCQLANRMLRELGLDRHVRVEQADGRHFDYHGHTIIMVAANTTGLRETVARAITTGDAHRVMMRSVDGLRTLLYKPATQQDIAGFGMQRVGQADPSELYYNSSQVFVPPFALIGEIGHDSKLDNRFSRYMPNMYMKKNLFLVSLKAQ